MKKILLTLTAALSVTLSYSQSQLPSAKEIKEIATSVADWQIEHFEDQAQYRAHNDTDADSYRFRKYHDLQWQQGAFYEGLYQFSTITYDRKYVNWLADMAEKHEWALHDRLFHADDHVVGQFYLDLAGYYSQSYMYQPTKERFDKILASDEVDNWHWTWCDALFMAPPVWANLSKLSGEQRYIDYMHEQYMMTYDTLWDSQERLFFRDTGYLTKTEENGEKLFWSRGNGWVFGGLALMIPNFPAGWEHTDFYKTLFKEMAQKLKEIQRADGTWSAGLLGDVDYYKNIETSGTSFFAFGLAWGINCGLLDRESFEPVLLKAWSALCGAVNSDGMLTYVQGVAAKPGGSKREYTEVYGNGAFLAAAAEMFKYVNNFGDEPKCDHPEQSIFMTNGGWCWYQGQRAVISNGKLIIGGVDGKNGDVNVAVYDLKGQSRDGQITLHSKLEADDHDAPALYVRPDGSILSVWAKHAKEKRHHYNISQSDDYLEWGEAMEHIPGYEGSQGLTYMNLYYLKKDKKLYNFFRDGLHYNPAFTTSYDHGATWGEYTHLIANEVSGRNRPYTIYSQKDKNTVGIVYTDAHPRDYGNSLYYVEFRGGNFYRADGTKLHSLKDGAFKTTLGEKLYTGSETKAKPKGFESVPNSSWNCAMITDKKGNPHIGYTLYLSNDDHRFRITSWDGKKWNDREIAYAGHCLYHRESSYTGLMAIDPTDPTIVYISTDVNPSTGEQTGGAHEIYRAKIKAEDDINTIEWQAVTSDSKYRNIRPVIVTGEGYKVLLWLNGEWNNFKNYNAYVVGEILESPTK